MKALLVDHPGSPEVMKVSGAPEPIHTAEEVLIRVAYAGINFTDVMARQGVALTRQTQPTFPMIPGLEATGVVVSVGDQVTGVQVGDRVVGFVRGACAEFAVARGEWCWRVPAEIALPDSLSALVQGLSALLMLRDVAHLQQGESVLVHSGAGGVGSLAIQVARLLGSGRVVATASTGSKRELCTRLGASQVFDYTHQSWSDGVEPVDVVLDAIGGRVSENTFGLLAPRGRWVVYGLSSKEIAPISGTQLMAGNQIMAGFWLTSWMRDRRELPVPELLKWMATGALRPAGSTVYALADAPAAHEDLASRRTVGKLILDLA